MSYLDVALPLVARFEGYRARRYIDAVGVPTRYYGETKPSIVNGPQLSEPQARRLLRSRLADFGRGVDAAVKVKLTAHQHAALTSFAYNVGLGAFRGSTLLRRLNKGDYRAVPAELMRWTKGGGRTLAGLVTRRRAETKLFGSQVDPLWPLKGDERHLVDRLLFHRRVMRDEEPTGRGPRYRAHREHAERYKAEIEKQMRALRAAGDWNVKARGARGTRGSRYQALKLVLGDRDGRL